MKLKQKKIDYIEKNQKEFKKETAKKRFRIRKNGQK